jgi:hypothetical protein
LANVGRAGGNRNIFKYGSGFSLGGETMDNGIFHEGLNQQLAI